MRRETILSILLLIAYTLAPEGLRAQRFEEVMGHNPWNASLNRAGLRCDTTEYSYAEVWGTLERGGLMNHSSTDKGFDAGGRTESIRHFKRLSFAGNFAYDYFSGSEMWGSMFTTPGSWPVDLYEYTPGRKIRERYAFEGDLSADMGEHWRLGIGIDFMAGNYAKRKDLRHKNTTLDFEVIPAVQWHKGRWAVGAVYLFEKHTESVEAEEIGSTPDSYKAFLDKGLYYGVEQLWTSGDLHLDESGISSFPIQKNIHGAGLQLQYGELFGEAAYRHTSGDTGEKGSVWHEFEGDRLSGLISWHHRTQKGARHILRAEIDWQLLKNREVILTTTTEGGVTIPTVYGSVPILEQRTLHTGLGYEWEQGGSHFEAGIAYTLRREQSSLLYPRIMGQTLRQWHLFVRERYSWRPAELTLGMHLRRGSHSEWEASESGLIPESPYPMQQSELFAWENEYLTACRLGVELAVRIHLGKGFYTDLSALWEHGFNLSVVPQPNRITSTLAFGYRW